MILVLPAINHTIQPAQAAAATPISQLLPKVTVPACQREIPQAVRLCAITIASTAITAAKCAVLAAIPVLIYLEIHRAGALVIPMVTTSAVTH